MPAAVLADLCLRSGAAPAAAASKTTTWRVLTDADPDYKFRSWLEGRRIGYLVAVPCNQAVPGGTGTSRADVLAAHAPQQAWKRRGCGQDAKGPRMFDWVGADGRDAQAKVGGNL